MAANPSAYRVALVEDEGLIALDLRHRVEAAGYTVEGVEDNAAAALDLIGRTRPDLVLMDIRIKGEHDGIWAAQEVRTRFDIPVIFLTAHADAVTVAGARLAEPYGYVVKPFHNLDFRSLIETVVWKHRRDREQRLHQVWQNAVVRGAGEGLIAVNAEGSVVFMNEQAEGLTGCAASAAAGLSLLEVLPLYDSESGQPAITPLEDIAQGRDPDAGASRYFLRRARLEPILVDVRFGVHRDESGLVAIIVSFADVTDLASSAELARRGQVHREVVSLADGFAAECRTRFDLVLRHLEAVSAAGPGELPGVLDRARAAAQHGRELAIELAELSQPLPALDITDLHALVHSVVNAERHRPGLRPEFILNLPSAPVRILTARALCEHHLTRLMQDLRFAFPGRGNFRFRTALDETSSTPTALLILHAEPFSESPVELTGALRFRLAVCNHFLTATGGRAEFQMNPRSLRFTLHFPAVTTVPESGPSRSRVATAG